MTEGRAVIFDMDGVIVDSEPIHARAFQDIFEALGYGATHGMDFPAYYGRSDEALWVDFVAKHHPAQPLRELVDWKQRHFLELLQQAQPIFPAVLPLLEQIQGRFALGLASGSKHAVIDVVLGMRNLRRFFSVVVSVQDVPHGKPAPDVFLRTAQLLAVPPEACWVIEDAAAGVEAALAAGMRVIAITNSLPADKLARADQVVSGYEQIERLLVADSAKQAASS